MTDHDDLLEVGIAAGLDIPTALMISTHEDKPPNKKTGCSLIIAFVVIIALAGKVIAQLLH